MALSGMLVLVVEDDPDSREVGRKMLAHLGARVALAEDGERGLEQMRRACPDLVLCDLRMPRMDGYEFARRVRRLPERSHVRLVAVTALRDDAAYLQTCSVGFDAHLEKPITLEKLNGIAERLVLEPAAPHDSRRRSPAARSTTRGVSSRLGRLN